MYSGVDAQKTHCQALSEKQILYMYILWFLDGYNKRPCSRFTKNPKIFRPDAATSSLLIKIGCNQIAVCPYRQ